MLGWLPDLSTRHLEEEWMDAPDLDPMLHAQALSALARVNAISRTASQLWKPVQTLLREGTNRTLPMRLLDVACGGGEIAVALGIRAVREKLPLKIIGCDKSDVALARARERSRLAGLDNLEWRRVDVLQEPLGEVEEFNIVTCSLFLHHLKEAETVGLLREMARCTGQMVVVSDLRRSFRAWLLAWVACRVLTRSPVVRFDGPVSVRNAYSWEEMRELLDRAGLQGSIISRSWPERMLIQWRRSAAAGPEPGHGNPGSNLLKSQRRVIT